MPRKTTYFRKVPGKPGLTLGYLTYTAPKWHRLFGGKQPPMRYAKKPKIVIQQPKPTPKKKIKPKPPNTPFGIKPAKIHTLDLSDGLLHMPRSPVGGKVVQFQKKVQAEVMTSMAQHGKNKSKSAKVLQNKPRAPRMALVVKSARPKPPLRVPKPKPKAKPKAKPPSPLQSLPGKRKYTKKAGVHYGRPSKPKKKKRGRPPKKRGRGKGKKTRRGSDADYRPY